MIKAIFGSIRMLGGSIRSPPTRRMASPTWPWKKSWNGPRPRSSRKCRFPCPAGFSCEARSWQRRRGNRWREQASNFSREAGNPYLRNDVLTKWQAIVSSGPDGAFGIAVLPGRGHLVIHGPTDDYVLQEIASNRLFSNRPGGSRYYANAFVPLDLKPESAVQDVKVTLRPAVTIKGQLLGPDGKPPAEALMISRLRITPLSFQWRGSPFPLHNGRFELHGCDPHKSYPVFFLDPQHKLGAAVELAGKAASGEPVTVRLAPCGSATVGFVDAAGRPFKNHRPPLQMIVTPGPDKFDPDARKTGALLGDMDFVANIDRLNHWQEPPTDSQGRITWRA